MMHILVVDTCLLSACDEVNVKIFGSSKTN